MAEIVPTGLLRFASKPGVARAIGMLVFVGFALIFQMLLQTEVNKAAYENRLSSMSYGSMLRTRVDRELNALLFISSGLAGYLTVYHKNLDSQTVKAILANLYTRGKHIRNFGIAVGYRLTYVYPEEGNEKAVGLYYPDLPAQWPQVKEAIDSAEGVLAGPVKLVQGGSGLIYRQPIYIEGKYWGLLSTVIDTHSFLQDAFGELSGDSYDYAIRNTTLKGTAGDIIAGNPALFENPQAVLMNSEVPGGIWQYAVLPMKESSQSKLLLLARFTSYLLSLLLGFTVYYFLRDRARLTQQAMYDSLTGLANRRLLTNQMEQIISRLKRSENPLCAVLFFDLNGFKKINDRFGHKYGDIVLSTTAQRVRAELRGSDVIARLGGDEFVIVIEQTSPEVVSHLEQRLRDCIAKPLEFDGFDLHVSAAIGIAYYPNDGETADALLKTADQRMYEDKGSASR